MNKPTLLAPLAAVLLLVGLFEGNVATRSSDTTISDWLARTGNGGWIVHALAEVVAGILILAYAQVLRSRLGGGDDVTSRTLGAWAPWWEHSWWSAPGSSPRFRSVGSSSTRPTPTPRRTAT